jgi:molybdenum cofactor cytidylyltransferase
VIAGLIPAAGDSRRMGRPKLALPLLGRPLLAHVVAALRDGGADSVLVVLGPHVADLAEVARAAGAEALVLDEPTPDMRATIKRGLGWIEAHWTPGAEDAWLLAPGDHPTLDAGLVRRVIEARRESPESSIIVPTHEGKRGHPALIGWRHVAGLRAHRRDEGLNAYLRLHAGMTLEIAAGPSAVEDVDTPEDYERLVRETRRRHG